MNEIDAAALKTNIKLEQLASVAAIVLYWGMQKADMTTLYSSLSESEKSRVLTSLKNMGVDVQLDPATGEILVPSDEYHQCRENLSIAIQKHINEYLVEKDMFPGITEVFITNFNVV